MYQVSDNLHKFKTFINECKKIIFIDKNPVYAIELIDNFVNTSTILDLSQVKQLKALAYFENRDYLRASQLYQELQLPYQAGFSELLCGNEKRAKEIWNNTTETSSIHWGKCLIDLIHVKVNKIPSFLQIRNFLESDISYFIVAEKLEYAENLIQCAEVLASINPESYKFIGKALLYNDFPNIAASFFFKSQEIIPNDPEIYYHLGQYSNIIGAYSESINMLNECLDINSSYSPAKVLLEKVKLKLNNKIN